MKHAISPKARADKKGLLINNLNAVDWSFCDVASATGLYHIDEVNNLHWYPGRCIPNIPSALFSVLSSPGQVLLDPFVGSGTIAVTGARCGLVTIGIDINPIACMISKAKSCLVEPKELRQLIDSFNYSNQNMDRISILNGHLPFDEKDKLIPNIEENKLWYHPQTLLQLGIIKKRIDELKDPFLHNIALVCFSSMLRACSSQQNHWGYICDNMRPKIQIEKNAFKIFSKRLKQFVEILISHYNYIRSNYSEVLLKRIKSMSSTLNIDARTINKYISDNTVDIIVTSPPYPGVNDYADSQRLTFLWFDDGEKMHRDSRTNEIGARWKRFRKKSIDEFLLEMSEIIPSLYRVLKPNGYFCLIYGESTTRIRTTDSIVSEICSDGFCQIAVIDRKIPRKRTLIPKIMNETIHIFQRNK